MSDVLSELGAFLATMDPDDLARELEHMDPESVEVIERALAGDQRLGWRATPATLAAALDPTYKRWAYVDLLADRVVDAFRGDDPHQIWNMPSQYGKGLDLETPIPTLSGWRRMGDLKTGDGLFDRDGEPCTVTLVADTRLLDCYRLVLHDGSELVADGDHLWSVWNIYREAWEVRDTRALLERPHVYRLPPTPGIRITEEVELPIHPYALGCWLGDGMSSGPGLTCAEDELLEHLALVGEPARRAPATADRWRCTWAGTAQANSTFTARLRALGVLRNKHVPDAYLWADDKQRLALLQGLMDTDGSCCPNQSGYTQCEFTSTKRTLAESVRFLARSLGIRAKMSEGVATLEGRVIGPKWRVTFVTEVPVFRLSRKLRSLGSSPGPRKGPRNIGIKSIEPTASRPTRCIQVDSPSSTYLAGDHLTVTHNTSMLVWAVVWALDFDPTLRIMYISHDANKAVEEGGRARDLAEKHQGQLRFRLRADRRARGMWRTTEGGGLYCVGVNGSITGWPADALFLDDLIKGWQAAHSEAQRKHVMNVYRSQIRMRVQSNRNPIIVAGTRWHELDPSGQLMADAAKDPHADQFTPTRLPALAEAADPLNEDPLLRLPDPLGRAPGEPLEPDRFPLEEVLARATIAGSYLAAAMEQQRPAPEEGGEIKRAWWKWFTDHPSRYDETLTSWDCKLKDNETGDFVVGQAWGRTGTDYWGIDQIRGHFNFATTKAAVALMKVRHPYIVRHVVENTGNGPEVMKELRRPQPDYVVSDDVRSALGMTDAEVTDVERVMRAGITGLTPENPKGSKQIRARAQTPLVESGHVHLPERVLWATALVNECAAFPNGPDDMVDTWSQAMKKLSQVGTGTAKKPAGQVRAPRPGQRAAELAQGRFERAGKIAGRKIRTPPAR